MEEEQREPLLSDYEPRVPVWTGGLPDGLISGSEIRAAASQDPYPSWINAGVVEPDQFNVNGTEPASSDLGHHLLSSGLQEDEIRELLIDHVSHHCCWKKAPAWSWKIQKVEDCNAYIGTLETFIEERDVVIEEPKPYDSRPIDNKGRVPGPWELDTREDFPPLFISKQVRLNLPHSETVVPCSECTGKGEVLCKACTSRDASGNIHQRKQLICTRCQGRGLTAHLDGSDRSCKECKGTGGVTCSCCGSRGLIKCANCQSMGAFLVQKSILVKWSTMGTRKVAASCHAASVPDEVFQRAKGAEIYCNQSQQCQRASFQNSPLLLKFSEEVLAERPPVPPKARIICERHRITVVPVTRVVMSNGGNNLFTFYVVGLKKDIYMKDYPQKCCCSCSIL